MRIIRHVLIILLMPFFLQAKVYDCFTFFNEFELLKMRFEELNDSVDYFVLVECTETHRGDPKNLYFSDNKHLFEKYLPKIIHVVVNERHPEMGLWEREHFQRNCILRGLQGCDPSDIIMISDVDEIPRPAAIAKLRSRLSSMPQPSFIEKHQLTFLDFQDFLSHCVHRTLKDWVKDRAELKHRYAAYALEMNMYRYQLNRIDPNERLWCGTTATVFANFAVNIPEHFRALRNRLPRLKNAGWHFTSMGGREKVRIKLASLVDSSRPDAHLIPDAEIDQWLNQHPIVPINSSFPQYVLKNEAYLRTAGFIAEYGLNPAKFHEKLKQPISSWVQEQIENDLGGFKELGISQRAIDTTLKKSADTILINWNQPHRYDLFARYRIIDNKIFRKKHDNSTCYFDDVLIRLSKMIDLPNVDFILALSDGVPESYAVQDFWVTENRSDQAPIFARSKKIWARHVVILPDYSAFSLENIFKQVNEANRKYPWSKKVKKAFWRGVPSDFWENQIDRFSTEEIRNIYSTRPRFIVSKFSVNHPDLADAGITSCYGHAPLLKAFLEEERVMKPERSIPDHIANAYLPCLDGWSCTYPGYYWRLLSNSVVFKNESDQQLWFYRALKPNEHYIPLKYDCSDLEEKLKWAKANDAVCQQIAENATRFVLDQLTEEDNFLYVYRALKYYESLQQFNCMDLLSETLNASEWIRLNPDQGDAG